jgi:stage V sporulation protein SpoVS
MDQEKILKVGSKTDSVSLSKCIVSMQQEGFKDIYMRGVGAGAVSQMTKATIISKGVLAQKGVNLRIDPSFQDIPSRKEEGKNHYRHSL